MSVKLSVRDYAKKEDIKSCFLSKGIIDYIPTHELERYRFNLDDYVNRLFIYMLPTTEISEFIRIYNNLIQKYREASEVLERITKERIENRIYYPNQSNLRDIYYQFLGHTINPTWFPNIGMDPNLLGETALHYIHLQNRNSEGHFYNYNRLIGQVRDLLECWILVMSLIIPNIKHSYRRVMLPKIRDQTEQPIIEVKPSVGVQMIDAEQTRGGVKKKKKHRSRINKKRKQKTCKRKRR
jgi:hypothetical protein